MFYQDLIYGRVEITEPVVLEIIATPEIERLKGIDQAGYRHLWKKPNVAASDLEHSRFAHSLGVYFLLRHYGAPLAEQLAGLIHDLSHTTFSHCIDYIPTIGSGADQSHQDNVFDAYFKNSCIPDILKQYGFDPDYIGDDVNFPLKEKNLPDLCADRIDYSFREARIFEEASEQDIVYFLEHLIIRDNNWIFKDLASAQKYAELFHLMNEIYYSSFSAAVMHQAVGDYVGHALAAGYITERDLYSTDKEVLNKIEKYLDADPKLQIFFDHLNKKNHVTNNPYSFGSHVFVKSRIVDPLFDEGGRTKRLSDADPRWGKIVEQELKPKEYFLKFEN